MARRPNISACVPNPARLTQRAAQLGFIAERGRNAHQGNVSALLAAICSGEVELKHVATPQPPETAPKAGKRLKQVAGHLRRIANELDPSPKDADLP